MNAGDTELRAELAGEIVLASGPVERDGAFVVVPADTTVWWTSDMASSQGSGPTARLSDIAAQAGVSEATVSRVLNGKAGRLDGDAAGRARRAGRARLRAARPVAARSAGLIGLITPELNNPIFPAFAQVHRAGADPARLHAGAVHAAGPAGPPRTNWSSTLVDRGVNGIIFVSGLHADTTANMDRYVKLAGRGVPFVMINGYTEKVAAPFVSPDDRAAMRLAVTHLVELGHQRIGLAVGPAAGTCRCSARSRGSCNRCAPCCRSRPRRRRARAALAVHRRGRAGSRGRR